MHRSNLAWESVGVSVREVNHIFQQLTSICSYFHKSGLRSRELRKVADEHGLKLLRLPKTFEVRWTEFTNDLLQAVLHSLSALVKYFATSTDKAAVGYHRFLTDNNNIQTLAFLADVLTVYSRFQKKIQSDDITIVDVSRYTQRVKSKLLALKTDALTAGWVQMMESSVGILRRDNIILETYEHRQKKEHHKYVTDRRDFLAIRNEVIDSLVEFVSQRFQADEKLLSVVQPFVQISKDADIVEIHKLLCSDSDLQSLSLEYDDLIDDADNVPHMRKKTLRDLVVTLSQSPDYTNVTKALSRLLAAKPHSADVERLISASNNLKSVSRSTMKLNTENMYLFIHYNMPVLTDWDPKPAIIHWMNNKCRRVRDRTKGRQQSYFKGVFAEAQDKPDDTDAESE